MLLHDLLGDDPKHLLLLHSLLLETPLLLLTFGNLPPKTLTTFLQVIPSLLFGLAQGRLLLFLGLKAVLSLEAFIFLPLSFRRSDGSLDLGLLLLVLLLLFQQPSLLFLYLLFSSRRGLLRLQKLLLLSLDLS